MGKLIRLYIRSCLIGFGVAAAFVGLLLALDVAHLRHLVFQSGDGLLAVVILWVLNGIVFAGVQFGFAVMQLADGGTGGGGLRAAVQRLTPARRSWR